jgi:hypothetical protein
LWVLDVSNARSSIQFRCVGSTRLVSPAVEDGSAAIHPNARSTHGLAPFSDEIPLRLRPEVLWLCRSALRQAGGSSALGIGFMTHLRFFQTE